MKAKIIDKTFYIFTIYFILTNFLLQIAIVPMCKYISLLSHVRFKDYVVLDYKSYSY